MGIAKILNFDVISDNRGSLISLEQHKQIPFAVKRVYYLFDNKPNHPRGFHAHRFLKQVIVCVSGRCKFIIDNGFEREEIILNSPSHGLLIDRFLWREMHEFSEETVIMVLADGNYEEADYVRSYKDFKKLALAAVDNK